MGSVLRARIAGIGGATVLVCAALAGTPGVASAGRGDLTVTVSPSSVTLSAGSQSDISVLIHNSGRAASTGRIAATLPPALTAEQVQFSGATSGCEASGGTVVCAELSVPPGATTTLTLSLAAPAGLPPGRSVKAAGSLTGEFAVQKGRPSQISHPFTVVLTGAAVSAPPSSAAPTEAPAPVESEAARAVARDSGIGSVGWTVILVGLGLLGCGIATILLLLRRGRDEDLAGAPTATVYRSSGTEAAHPTTVIPARSEPPTQVTPQAVPHPSRVGLDD
ncbi:hypothetical protein R8Z50_33245 [Longispora sp. K20-0274]|uniref:hypothetical protein n=1 Tax=Longispora sp. K20-0274 TaxID=3088255 RepID=UPI00399AB66A